MIFRSRFWKDQLVGGGPVIIFFIFKKRKNKIKNEEEKVSLCGING